MSKKQTAKAKTVSKPNPNQGPSCSLCGRLYNNFVFKGGYICEDCLDSIKDFSSDEKEEQQ